MELPEGPADFDQVKRRAGIPDDDVTEDDDLQLLVAAVNELVQALPVAVPVTITGSGDQVDTVTWPARVQLGANMLAARLWRRKDTPGGVEAFGDFGVAYVRRNDPDVALLLQLGQYASPVVG